MDQHRPEIVEAVELDPATLRLLTALLRLPADEVAQVRAATSGRRRPLRQTGPTLDLGD